MGAKAGDLDSQLAANHGPQLPALAATIKTTRKEKEMSSFGDDLIQAMTEALAHAKGEGPAIVHAPMAPREGGRMPDGIE